jgi:hypothetical protein
MPLTTAVWTLIFLAALSLLWLRRHWLSAGLLGTGYVLALIAGLLGWSAAGRNAPSVNTRGSWIAPRFSEDLEKQTGSSRGPLHPRQWFYRSDEIIQFDGDTFIANNQWDRHTERFLRNAAAAFADYEVSIEAVPPE